MLRAARPSTANISAAWRGVPLAATGRGYLFTGLSHALPSSSSESPPVNSSNRHTAVGSLQDELYHYTSVISGKGSGVVGRVQRWCSSACRSFSCLYALQTSSAHADGCAFCFCPLPLEVHGRTKAYAARALPDSLETKRTGLPSSLSVEPIVDLDVNAYYDGWELLRSLCLSPPPLCSEWLLRSL